MPDKAGGWRRKIHGGRTKTPIPPKSPRRPTSGWRRTLQGNQPDLPAIAAAASTAGRASAPVPADAELNDARSEYGPEPPTSPCRKSGARPTLTRLLSDYRSFKESTKEPGFSEWWSEDAPSVFAPLVDPLIVLQSVHSYLVSIPSQPIPVHHNNGLLRIFEDYRKVRTEKERMDELLQQAHNGLKSAEELLEETESNYQEEIRRLELIIARGTAGMSGLMQARNGSVVDRKRNQRRSAMAGRPQTAYELLSREDLDEQIKLRSQRVLLQRPSSPSGRMVALSRHFSDNASREIPIGAPPSQDKKVTLSRKAKSELDLFSLAKGLGSGSNAPSVYSEFSETGDALPDEMISTTTILDNAVESEAFTALRELGAMVARRKGINAKKFVDGLVSLLSPTDEDREADIGFDEQVEKSIKEPEHSPSPYHDSDSFTPAHRLRHFLSQPHLGSDQRRRRHFSFEPGDDQLATLVERLRPHVLGKLDPDTQCGDAEPTRSSDISGPVSHTLSGSSSSQSQALNAGMQKPSKIPSPVTTLARVRRETSTSSLQTVLGKGYAGGRRESRSSIVTAFRQSSHGSLLLQSTSRSGSMTDLHQAEGQHMMDPIGSPRTRNSGIAVAAGQRSIGIHPTANTDTALEVRSYQASCASGKVGSRHKGPQSL